MKIVGKTMTGFPLIDCTVCGKVHPASRRHCGKCGRASLFLAPYPDGLRCIRCAGEGK